MRNILCAGCLIATVLALGACSDEPSSTTDTDDHSTESTIADITDVVHSPASGDFVGALADISNQTCAQEAGGWRATGTATNSTGAPADYRIYISLLNSASTTRALVETEILDVAAGAVGTYDKLIALPDEDLQCVLRVERRATGT